jgi:hypothetical protein
VDCAPATVPRSFTARRRSSQLATLALRRSGTPAAPVTASLCFRARHNSYWLPGNPGRVYYMTFTRSHLTGPFHNICGYIYSWCGTGLWRTAPLQGPHIRPQRYTLWNNNRQRKPEFLKQNRAIQPLYLPQIPYGLPWYASETSVVRRGD